MTNQNLKMSQIEKLPLTSMNIKESQIEKLKDLFPEIFTEGNKVDWEKLKLTLGENVDVGKERFGMNWPGKADCFKTIQQPSIATLVPIREESVDFDNTQNLFIEGDNLEVLKLLQKSYLGKIKMIYIDPPYNTGNDFIYPDNYSENLATYLEYTGQIDSEGKKFSTNTETDGRFHSKWMNMMYPRLFLAKNLLREDGIIFISIDDAEQANLKLLCNEIFGEENFLGTFVWQSKKGGGSDSKTIVQDHEYILCFSRLNPEAAINKILIQGEDLNRKDEKGEFRLGRELNKWGSNSRREDRPTMWFSIKGPNNFDVYPIRNDGSEGCWRLGKKRMEQFVKEGNIEFVKRPNGTYIAYEKIRSTDPRQKPYRTWLNSVPTTADGSKEVKELFEDKKLFDFPKPSGLLKHLISIGTQYEDDIVMDFFAGSCSLAQAVISTNLENEEKNLKFICIQLPQETEVDSPAFKEGFKDIFQLGRERISRFVGQSKKSLKEKPALFSTRENIDLGFKVFKLGRSNFKIWEADIEKTKDSVQSALDFHIDHLSVDADQQSILFEILLKSGFDLTTSVQTIEIGDKTVYGIADGELLICLEKNLTHELIKEIANMQPTRVICLDEGFQNNDQLKTNAVQIMKSKNVVSFRTV